MPTLRSMLVTLSGGASFRVTLPGAWCKSGGVKNHDELQVLDSGVLVIFPPHMDKDLDIEKFMIDLRGGLTFMKR